jgi:hypothetical protein
MWNRADVKEKGKLGAKRNYWGCIFAAFIFSLCTDIPGTVLRFTISDFESDIESVSQILKALTQWPFGVSVLLAIFVFNVICFGCNKFFLLNQLRKDQAFEKLGGLDGCGEILSGFKNNYQNIFMTMFIQDLLVSVGLILFIIPGIIMTYQYRMVPYILTEKPELSPGEVLTASKEMMDGNKWNAFVYDFSFLGWEILGALTFGILSIFYVYPWKYSSDAELYIAIRSCQMSNTEYRSAI